MMATPYYIGWHHCGYMEQWDEAGLDVVYLQAKRWENTVRRPEIQKFVGARSTENGRRKAFF